MKFKRKEKINEEEFLSINGNDYVSFPGDFLHHAALWIILQGYNASIRV
jgi:hypothetical protein